jgi:S-layer homology domain
MIVRNVGSMLVAATWLLLLTGCSKSSQTAASATEAPAVVSSPVTSEGTAEPVPSVSELVATTPSPNALNAPAPSDSSATPASLPAISSAPVPVSGATAAPVPASGAIAAAASAKAVAYSDIAGNFNAPNIVALGTLGVLDSTSGAFRPNDPIKRRDFVRWLFKLNNVLFADSPQDVIHPAASSETSSFKDLTPSDSDFQYAQGLADAGVSVGFPDKTFRADALTTREQAVTIKATLDYGGVLQGYSGPDNLNSARLNVPNWKDRTSIESPYIPAIATDDVYEGSGRINNIGRTFGTIALFRPQMTLSRGEAATMISVVGAHGTDPGSFRTAAQALQGGTATP